jgi:hypothetical protein
MHPITALMISTSEEEVRNRTLRRRHSWLDGMHTVPHDTGTSKVKGIRLPRIFRFAT